MKSFFKDKLLSRPTAVIAVMNIVFCILSCVLAGLMNYSFISIALAALLWLACQALIVYLYRNAREDWLSWVKEHWYIFLVLIIVLARNLLTLAQCWMGIDAAGLYARLGVSCTIFTFYGISTFTEMLVFQDYSFAKLFAVQSLLVGMLFNQFFPLFSIADEPRHITTAYEVSNAMLGIKSPKNGMYMRKDDADYYFSFPEYTRDDANNYLAQLAEPLKDGSLVLVEDSAPYNTPDGITAIREKPYPTEMYQYLAPALGITIGRLLKLNTVSTYMLGRLINLIVYTFMITLALHIVPLGKSALYTIALLPMSMQLATSLSRDVFRICIAVMTISLTMYLFYTEKRFLKHRNIATGALVVCSCLLLPVRTFVYSTIALMPLLIYMHRKKWLTEKMAIYAFIAIAVVGILALAVKYLLFPGVIVEEPMKKLTWMDEYRFTIQHFINYPLDLVWLLRNTFWTKTVWYYETMVGSMLGWLDVPLADIAVSAFSIVLLFNTIRRDYEPVTLSNTFRFSVFILSAISAVLMICGMIITWTPITWTAAEGVQGRYFLLLLFPILLSFRGKTFTANEKCDKICISVQFAALVFTSIFMLLRLM